MSLKAEASIGYCKCAFGAISMLCSLQEVL